MRYLERSLLEFDKMKWVFKWHQLNSNREEMGHFNISKLHVLTHHLSLIKLMCILDNISILYTEALHMKMINVYYSRNKVDYVSHMCF